MPLIIKPQRLLIFPCLYVGAYAKIKRPFNKIIQFAISRYIASTTIALNELMNQTGKRIRKMRQSHFNFPPIAHFAIMTMYMPGMGIAAGVVSMRARRSENRQI